MTTINDCIQLYNKYSSNEFILNNKIEIFSNLRWIGSGLAKISASYANDICVSNRIISNFNSSLHYKHYKTGTPILISLGGKGDDAINISKEIKNSIQKGFVTCNKNSIIYDILGKCSSFSNPSYPDKDDRFVNLNGIIALSYLSEAFVFKHLGKEKNNILLNTDKIETNTSELFNKITKLHNWNNNIYILGIGYNSSIEHSWRSILQESAISQISWQDIKDYTHGDHSFSSLNPNKIFILLDNNETEKYCDIFEKRFSQICQVHRIKLSSNITHAFWENLFYIISISHKLSCHLGFQGKRPTKNELVYSWKGWGNL